MTSSNREPEINPAEYSALTNFLRGYLHQDASTVHGSAIRAAQAFRRDAGEREAAIVHAELERLLDEASALPDAELSLVLERLGSAWQFRTRQEIEQLRDALK
jgi:hypothetical protein